MNKKILLPLAGSSAHAEALSSHLSTSLMLRVTPGVVDKLYTATNELQWLTVQQIIGYYGK